MITMNDEDKINEWLGQLNSEFKLNEDGLCAFTYDGIHAEIELSENGKDLLFTSPVLEDIDPDDAELMYWALSCNYYQDNMSGANYALDEQTLTLLLCYIHHIRPNDDSTLYNNILANFLQITKACKEKASNFKGEAPAEDKPSSENPKEIPGFSNFV